MAFTPLTDGEVLRGVRELSANGKIRWTDHSEDQMAARGFDRGQIRKCLQCGYFSEDPAIANRSGPTQYKFTMRAMVDGQEIAVAASLIPEARVVVITVFEPN